ncbi:unnamed protein product [Hapterophycus canaliculatus]
MNRDRFVLRHRNQEKADATPATPLDSDEQEKVVQELTNDVKHQTTFFVRAFSGVLLMCGVLLVRCSVALLFARESGEGSLPHRAILTSVPDAAFHATYLGQLVGLYLAHRVARGSGWHITPGFMVSWTSLFSWLAVFRHFGVTNPLFFWMPLAPAVTLAVAVYLFTSQRRLQRELEELKGARYNLKGA